MTNCNANATNSIAKLTNSTAKATNSIAKPTNSIANGTNSIAIPTNSIAIPTNSIANGMHSIAKATNSIAKTCKSVCSIRINEWVSEHFYHCLTPIYNHCAVYAGTLKTISEEIEIQPPSNLFAVVHISKYIIVSVTYLVLI